MSLLIVEAPTVRTWNDQQRLRSSEVRANRPTLCPVRCRPPAGGIRREPKAPSSQTEW